MNPELGIKMGFLIAAIAAFVVALTGISTFDEIVEAEYLKANASWVADGRPRGHFWYPPEFDSMQGRFTGIRLSFVLLFITPTWIRESLEIRKLVRRYRLCTWYWYASIIGLPVLFIVFLNCLSA